jgi:hypothetical protein
MKTSSRRIVLTFSAAGIAIVASLLLITALSLAQAAQGAEVPKSTRETASSPASVLGPSQGVSVTFPPGDWPPYAQEEIGIHPEPPIAHQPTELCAEVINLDRAQPHTAILEFSVANFGIGVPFHPVGRTEVVVPPSGHAVGCVVWVPPEPGHWCIQAAILFGEHPPQFSQRNIDIWEPLVPGEPHQILVPVGPFPEPTTVTFTHKNLLPGWDAALDPISMTLPANQQGHTSLTVWPPGDEPLGSQRPIVDVEGYAGGELIGGFRKFDWPPVPLHRTRDPFFAESEISVWPYPPRADEPTEICVELRNLRDQPQEVEVQFSWANFGINLPFHPINGPIVVALPPHGSETVCIGWVPPEPGHFCVQVRLDILGPIAYEPQFSQRNLDVNEPLRAGVPHVTEFPVGNHFHELFNPEPMLTNISLTTDIHLPGWKVELKPPVLERVLPGTEQWVTMIVTPSEEFPPPDGAPVVDVRAMVDSAQGPRVIGGIRKLYRPPIQLHPFPDPPYAEREITVHPFPPNRGEPTEVCVELRNPTTEPQDVLVHFSWAAFGIGIPFTPIDGPRQVHLPPHSIVRECIHWIPPVSGHVCLQVELEMEGHHPQRSQLNLDVDEPLIPGEPHTLRFPVGNPFDGEPLTITLGYVPLVDGWEFLISPDVLPGVEPFTTRTVSLTVKPPAGTSVLPPDHPIPPNGLPVVDVEAHAGDRLIGGFRKIVRPPITLHPFDDPPYAEREITVHPETLRASEPAEVCVELRNPTSNLQEVMVQFSWAAFGIGLPFQPIDGLKHVPLPPHSIVNECVHWIPPVNGHVCLEVELFIAGFPSQHSQRNLDVDEPLEPGFPHSRSFAVGNPFDDRGPVTITLGLIPHLADWNPILSTDLLTNVQPGPEGVKMVELTVHPPRDEPMPEDGTPIVDVEAFVEGELIGGFRKIFSPPGAPHRPKDPIYAESEIFVHPYPTRAQEPTEIGVEVRNPTDDPQVLTITFSFSEFGIGLPFHPIHDPVVVEVPPHGLLYPAIVWIPPHGGLWCIQVEIELPNHEVVFWSRRNIDVGEPLEPNVSHSRPFLVRNPYTEAMTITLGLIPHFPDWGLELSQDTLLNVPPHGRRVVTLTVTPPNDLPEDGDPIVDVEGYVEGELIGGFRKIFRPPVPVHRPKDPVYAESEIGIDPYPVIPGQPAVLSVEVFNPTDKDRIVTATFSIAPFGIGLPFSTTHITPNPIHIFVPKFGAARGHVVWEPPLWRGKFCVMVELQMEGHEKIWSRRNIDVGEPLERGQPHSLPFWVGNWPYTGPVTVTLGLIPHRDGWNMSLSETTLRNLSTPVSVTLTVTPSLQARLGTGEPIVDVEGFVDGELLGGFRKLDVPPIPLHKPHEKTYAETELSIDPDPPQLGKDARISAVIQNNGPNTSTVIVEFGWAQFGMGIPFTTTGLMPTQRVITLGPAMTTTAWVTWTPSLTGSNCIMVTVVDPAGDYEDLVSQRNVRVIDRPPCDRTLVYNFTVYNDSDITMTVDIGLITFDVPADWTVTTDPTDTLTLPPFTTGVVTVTVYIPCPSTLQAQQSRQDMYALQQQAGSVATIDVEGYNKGELVGGIELQFGEVVVPEYEFLYLPMVLRN